MNETEHIKIALTTECVTQFVNAVTKWDSYDDLDDRNKDIQTWSLAVLASLAIKDKVDFIQTKQGEI
jgi:hypothetical protein